jgi:beta-xylosidase
MHSKYKMVLYTIFLSSIILISLCFSQKNNVSNFNSSYDITLSKVWVPDNGDGTYKNPIIYADYSDPDVIRVGDDFYLTSSSFNCVPGLPVLHSNDLVNWKIIGSVFNKQIPIDVFNKPQHGNGAWAPSIRYHNNEFYIYYGDPDFGIYMTKAKNPAGPWDAPILVKEAKGWIDPCPFWDNEGGVFLVHAFAGSRAGIKSILVINRMNKEGTKILDDGILVFDGHNDNPIVEGPKLYKRNSYFYIFAPAGGVKNRWQLVLRSKNIYGPYEKRVVMDQGNSPVNGPHQGGWVETQNGESWFVHFQDSDAYGRIVHLQPVKWINDWPVIGIDKDEDGKGEPVLTCKKPDVGKSYPKATPQSSDEFNSIKPGLQWQWQANPQSTWMFPFPSEGFLRLNAVPLPDNYINFWDVPNLLLQKFTAPEFTVTTKLTFNSGSEGEKTGLIIMGTDYSYISVKQSDGKLYLSQTVCYNADKKNRETESDITVIDIRTVYLRVKVNKGAICNFSFSSDGKVFNSIGKKFIARTGKWIGAKVGIFCIGNGNNNDAGYADFDWFRIE